MPRDAPLGIHVAKSAFDDRLSEPNARGVQTKASKEQEIMRIDRYLCNGASRKDWFCTYKLNKVLRWAYVRITMDRKSSVLDKTK